MLGGAIVSTCAARGVLLLVSVVLVSVQKFLLIVTVLSRFISGLWLLLAKMVRLLLLLRLCQLTSRLIFGVFGLLLTRPLGRRSLRIRVVSLVSHLWLLGVLDNFCRLSCRHL